MDEEYEKENKKPVPNGPDPNAWLVTFTDLVMLLLTFFVMLFSARSVDKTLLNNVFAPLFKYVFIDESSGEATVKGRKSKIILGREMLKREIDKDEALKKLTPTENERGISISLETDSLFESGEARLPLSGWHLMDSLGKIFRNIDNDIIIIGHTDDIPVKSEKYRDNASLSIERALAVARYLSERADIPASRIAAGGHGDSMPAFPNDSEKNRKRNRRIEFILRRPE